MSAQLITQVTKVLPKILIIGDESDLSLKVAENFREKNFRVVYYPVKRILDDDSIREKFQTQSYYKIIYFFNLTGNHQSLKTAQKILAKRREPTMVITRFDTAVETNIPRTHSWFSQTLTQYQNITALAEKYPRVGFLIAQDLILNDSAFHPAREFFWSRFNEGEILSPGFNFSFVSQNSFLEQIQALLFSPFSGEKMMFITNKITWRSIFNAFANVEVPKLKVVEAKLPVADFEFSFPLIVYSGVSDLNFVTKDHLFFSSLTSPAPSPQSVVEKTKVVKKIPPLSPDQKETRQEILARSLLTHEGVKTSSPAKKKILAQARRVLTNHEEGFLSRYLAGGDAVVLANRIDLRSFDFLQSAVKPVVPATFAPKKTPSLSPTPILKLDFNSHQLASIKVPPVAIPLHHPPVILPQSIRRPSTNDQVPTSVTSEQKAKTIVRRKKARQLAKRQRRLALIKKIVAMGAVVLVVGGGIVFYRRQMATSANQSLVALTDFINTCAPTTACLNQGEIGALPSPSASSPGVDEALAKLQDFLTLYQAFNAQVGRLSESIWQNPITDVVSELGQVEEKTNLAQTGAKALQDTLAAQEVVLSNQLPKNNYQSFKNQLTAAQENLNLVKKNLALINSLSAFSQLPTAFILLDNSLPHRGGGQIYGYATTQLLAGKTSDVVVSPLAEVVASSAVKINPSDRLIPYLERDQDLEGAAHLAFNRSYKDVAALSRQILQGASSTAPELLIGFNVAALARLQAVVGNQDVVKAPTTLMMQLRQQTSLADKENMLISNFKTLNTALARSNTTTLINYFYQLLTLLNEGEILLYSPQEQLATQIASLNYDGELMGVICPPGFGTETCFLDTFAQHENYLTASANLTQLVTHTIELLPDSTKHQRKIIFDNTAGETEVNSYLSFSLPYGARFDSLVVDEVSQRPDQSSGLTLVVPAGQTSTVLIAFSLNRAIAKNDLTYSFYNQRQYGLTGQTTQVIVNNRLPYNQKIIAPSAINEQKNIVFNQVIDQSFQGAVVF